MQTDPVSVSAKYSKISCYAIYQDFSRHTADLFAAKNIKYVTTALLFIVGNIALRKPTLQSSTGFGGVSSRAVDGNANSQWGGSSCTHTNRQRGAWWRVDLGRVWAVGKVKITNRGDCCWGRLRAFEVRVGNTDRNPKANPL